jgi:hypothetical protein
VTWRNVARLVCLHARRSTTGRNRQIADGERACGKVERRKRREVGRVTAASYLESTYRGESPF